MDIKFTIPDEFKVHYKRDKFKDSLERILFDARSHRVLAGKYEWETIEMLINVFQKSEVVDEKLS